MSMLTATCPSGLVLDVRELKGREIRNLRESKNPMLEIVQGCTLKVADPGPYVIHDGDKPRWSEVLAGDMMTALLRIAEAGFGAQREPTFECQDQDCRKRAPAPTPLKIDLRAIPIKPITPEALAQFLDGNRFTCVIAGKRVDYRLPTGATIDAAFRAKPDAHEFQAVADSIYTIEGVREFPIDKLAWLDDLSAEDLTALGVAMREHEPGPEQGIKVQCRWCGRERVHALPFASLTMAR